MRGEQLKILEEVFSIQEIRKLQNKTCVLSDRYCIYVKIGDFD